MSTTLFRRPARRVGPAMPADQVELQEPPSVPEPQSNSLSTVLMYLPMAVMAGAMTMMMLSSARSGSMMTYIGGGLMGVAMVTMVLGQLARASTDRKHQLTGDRRDYLRYLSQVRRKVRDALGEQHRAAIWKHPDPRSLWSLVRSYRLWERRVAHEDFGEVRLGLGQQRSAVKLVPPQTKPVEDLEPLSAYALRRFLRTYTTLPSAPIAVYLRGFARIQLRGEPEAQRSLVRALLCQLVAFHSPADLTVAVCVGNERREEWLWTKWLPHAQDDGRRDGAGPLRLISDNVTDMEELLGGDSYTERPRFEPSTPITSGEPFVVVVVDGVNIPAGHRFSGGGYRNTVIVDIDSALTWQADRSVLHLEVDSAEIRTVDFDRAGRESTTSLCGPDGVGVVTASALARDIAPHRMGTSGDSGEPLTTDYELTSLLGVPDARTFDVDQLRRDRSGWQRMRVPIGIAGNGTPIELDIKESAEDGMGPHGMLIGATGSGKSELLRTLVLALVTTHASDELNLVLVDFKGGAAFLGFDRLPHTSAVITNLVDEIELVDRMQDALTGEMNRRQELLRSAGNYSSQREYEKARRSGVPLDPMPSLFVVVDEFSEMLVSKPEFIDVFAMIGRLGRSLGVHLLLASQRLDEGRISKVETHLSYRIGLRTFSAMESRSVIGVPDAYELPTTPGNGYLRSDTQTLSRFKAAYVSGVYRTPRRQRSKEVIEEQLVPFGGDYVEPRVRRTVEAPPEPEDDSGPQTSLVDVLIDRLSDHGPAAHQVWLPPMRVSPTLDDLLPPLLESPDTGLRSTERSTEDGLRVPLGLIDLPAQQRRELLTADLSGAQGHVGVVGGPQSGKSTVLRTMITALALTHSAAEAQFYCLDFGGGSLAPLRDLPHVGSVAGRLDRDRVTRTVQEIVNLLERREVAFQANNLDSMSAYRRAKRAGRFVDEDPYGDVFLFIDGWYTVRNEFDELEDRLGEIAARGLTFGIHLVVGAARWSDMRPWLRGVLGTRLELRLGDPVESEVNSRLAAKVPDSPGRGLTTDKQHFLAALPRVDGRARTDDLADAVTDLVEAVAVPGVPQAPPVRLLPVEVHASELPEPLAGSTGLPRISLGIDDVDLAPLWHDFDVTPHLMIFGDTETGKTNLLRHIARSVQRHYRPDQARLMFADLRRELHDAVPQEYQLGYSVSGDTFATTIEETAGLLTDRLPGPEITPDRLPKRDWWTGGRLFIVVDDHELVQTGMNNPVQALASLLPQAADIGFHLIIARSTSGAGRSMMDPVLRRMWELGTPGLLFSCPKDEGKFLGELPPKTLPVGRAQFVNRKRTVRLVQTPLLEPLATAER
ncbi:DNA segregation ATPase FtsK/SpoIIIE, S-DNA-T family [Actinopolyspora alba]|uniref:DNA segregation ATPase FtsK/SpoIIIE, S-DNA-T family n=1 Tax=Actinopolyspora alba TaxID=673379 RepID=A0A1I2AGQ4_9ACTN|nr:type VII secretion protein EccCa [Actinopolyspora alba]SFE43161.1 DNA segregation ATPase FtsK/SpoIIIE, S-DNA-T family [Actinopolyspora alba]